MNWIQRDYFLAVARTKSFGKAAESLFVTSSAVSKQIQSLELELGVELFSRSARGSMLTAAGQVFYEYFLREQTDFKNAMHRAHEVSGMVNRSLILGVPREWDISAELDNIAAEHFKNADNAYLRIELLDVHRLCKGLEEGTIDAVVCPQSMAINLYGVETRELCAIPRVLLYSAANPLSLRDDAAPSDFNGCTLFTVGPSYPALVSSQECQSMCESLSISYNTLETMSFDSVVNAVEHGTGFTVVDKWHRILHNTRFRGLTVDSGVKLCAAWNSNNWDPATQNLIAACATILT